MESVKLFTELNIAIEDLHIIKTSAETLKNNEELIEVIKSHIFNISTQLFKTSKLENYYWNFCSFSVYENHYLNRLNAFLLENDNDNFNESDFITREIKSIDLLLSIWYLDLFDSNTLFQIRKSFDKRKKYLNTKLTELESPIFDSLNVDFIDLGKISAKEKMVYLYKLGVIGFLLKEQPFTSTGNGLASILCSILGENKKTIQPIISAIVSNNLTNKNHPLYTESTEKRVIQHLINIGFNPNETN
ncbi:MULTISPECIES: hypothetical protein [unclassified Flavobacterium]|uniref:hypothetical protein n=1 Tax=unclassified Flavobacterium TaxID=196869 RepID=UPI00131DA8B9|nr:MULTISPECIES: hypothetical protein [unclassified Flavobacterium]